MTEIWFYQLQTRTLDQVVPNLIERTLQRGWRAVVQPVTPERLNALDDLLWSFSDESFVPHGSARDGDPELQAVWLTLGNDNPNKAQVRFLLEGADAAPFVEDGYQRLIVVFDGRDDVFLARARDQWRALRQIKADLAYWSETEEGGWRKQA